MHEDEHEAYLAGDYDVVCQECNGSGKVQVPNVAAMNFSEKRKLVAELREAQLDAQINAEWAMERASGL